MDIHRTDYLGLLLLLFINMRMHNSPEVPHESEQVESDERGERGKKMAVMLCRIWEMWRENLLLMEHEHLRKVKKT
jgi:hypothetical protein